MPTKTAQLLKSVQELIKEQNLKAVTVCEHGGVDYPYYKKSVSQNNLSSPVQDRLSEGVVAHLAAAAQAAAGVDRLQPVARELREAAGILTRALRKLQAENQG